LATGFGSTTCLISINVVIAYMRCLMGQLSILMLW
jgi:hypothetical protein